ncbi:uncharacterized protein PAC_13456 [Phialocephala subalpina]|uniref:Protein kinase domain-containing protein n=1 Tax=Phialocephala subalpina TaxID=576137 RepID=A0A1L7XET5_9HELO|nr:uncharacterized protein PAC_13456 [Phialocephala subalpina]
MDRLLLQQISTSTLNHATKAKKPPADEARRLGADRDLNEQTTNREGRDNLDDRAETPEEKCYPLLGEGYTAKIYRIPNSERFIKLYPIENEKHFLAEKAAYELLSANSPPPNIPTYYGTSSDFPLGMVLSRADRGDAYEYLYRARRMGPMPTKKDFYRWAKQAAQALDYAHSLHIMHADIHLLWDSDRKERDEEGKKIDMQINARSEIFALGSAIYHMVGGNDLWGGELEQKRDRDEIVRRLKAQEMPGTEELVCLGSVVKRCWAVEFAGMDDVVKAIEDEEREDEQNDG